ncbi:MAG: ABC transporter permease [bacterium]|nr:ABC transporter permease [bacterium]
MSVPHKTIRIYSAWYRHLKVYSKNFFSNCFPPIIEPLIFMVGIGLGLSQYITSMDNLPYIQFLAIGLPLASSLFTAAFECSYGTYIRLEYNKVYDYMLAGPLNIDDIFIGEIIWAGTKGFLFSAIVTIIFVIFRVLPLNFEILIIPVLGFITSIMVASVSLIFISFIKNINQINFFITGFISPMFMFSGTVFPMGNLPAPIQWIINIFPLAHTVQLARAIYGPYPIHSIILDIVYCIGFTLIFGYIAIQRMKKIIIK